ncbi:MAG: cobalamin B12-binding domain-containing protein, partial [Chloroflexi bacterium]|nr:cobalamin B12-binding domain-containing protein [Chloroflexota bacterium]
MRIALVSPKWNRLTNSYPPLGIGYLAAIAEADGHTVAIYDLGLSPDTPLADDVARVVAFRPDLVAMTAMTNNYHSAEQTFALLKERCPSPLLV